MAARKPRGDKGAKGGDRNRFRRTENEIQSPGERTRVPEVEYQEPEVEHRGRVPVVTTEAVTCPHCGSMRHRAVNSRSFPGYKLRRRHCTACLKDFDIREKVALSETRQI